jgi:hypothetical protein
MGGDVFILFLSGGIESYLEPTLTNPTQNLGHLFHFWGEGVGQDLK